MQNTFGRQSVIGQRQKEDARGYEDLPLVGNVLDDEVGLEKKLSAWEGFYNYDRPHGAHSGRTPYEVLREKLR